MDEADTSLRIEGIKFLDEIDFKLSTVFTENYRKFKNYIPFTTVAKDVMLRIYKLYLDNGKLKIEDLPREEKIKLIDECYECGATKENIKDMCKVLYTIKLVG